MLYVLLITIPSWLGTFAFAATVSKTTTFVSGTAISSSAMNQNFDDLLLGINQVCVHRDGTQSFSANQSMGGFKLTDLASPTAGSDAATKGYVDSVVSAGGISLPAPGSSGTAPNWSSSGSTHTLNIPLAANVGVTAGVITKAEYDSFVAKEPALSAGTTAQFYRGDKTWQDVNSAVRGALGATGPITYNSTSGTIGLSALGGDVSGTVGAVSVNKIQGRSVSAIAPTTGQALLWSGTVWAPTTVAAPSGYLSKSGDTMTGTLTLAGDPSAAMQAATKQYVDNSQPWAPTGAGTVLSFNGSVGIGLVAPAAQLHVNGDIYTNSDLAVAGIVHANSGIISGTSGRTSSNGGPDGGVYVRSFVTTNSTDGTIIYETPYWQLERYHSLSEFRLTTKTADNLTFWARSGTTYWENSANAVSITFSFNHGAGLSFEIFFGKSYTAPFEFTHIILHRSMGDNFWVGHVTSSVND